MAVSVGTLEDRLCAAFKRVFRRQFEAERIRVDEVEEWDSLSHIKLVMELESEFEIEIEPSSIAKLYSNFDVIVSFLREFAVQE